MKNLQFTIQISIVRKLWYFDITFGNDQFKYKFLYILSVVKLLDITMEEVGERKWTNSSTAGTKRVTGKIADTFTGMRVY